MQKVYKEDLVHKAAASPDRKVSKLKRSAEGKQKRADEKAARRVADFTKLMKFLFAFFIVDLLTREMLFDFSLPHLQLIAANRDDVTSKIMAIISEMSDKYAYVLIIGTSYHTMDTGTAFVVSCTIYTALAVLSILKSFNHEARPFFVTELTPTQCWREYGNPSGHSITSVSLYLTMWHVLCRRYEATPGSRKLTLAITLLVCFAIACSRIYNGVHTYN